MKVILLLGLGLLMACSRYHAPDQALADLPSQFREQKEQPKDSAIPKEDSKSQALALNLSWWEVFKNPQLNQMIEQLLSNNLSVAQAKTRVVQMRALATQAGSQLWPTLDLNLGFTRRKQLNMFSRLNPDDARKNMIAVMEASLRHNDRGMILMHDILKNSALALDFIIQKLYNDGYSFVHIKVN